MTSYEALRSSAAWFDLSPRGKIRAVGEDNARLLHAMCTNDVKNLAENSGLYAFFLNDKGRVLADAFIYRIGSALLLDTEPEAASVLRDHLDRYIIADDVTLDDETASWAAVGLEGPASFTMAEVLGIPVPAVAFAVQIWEKGFVARTSSTGAQGLRIFVPMTEKAGLVDRLKANRVAEAAAEEVRIVRLEHGTPRFGEDITPRFLAQETQAAHAVHLNKGCYLGQEIVERVRAQGQVHRLLSAVRIASTNPPVPETKLLADGKAVAEVTSAAYSPALGEVVALAYVRREALAAKPAMVVADSDPPVRAYLP